MKEIIKKELVKRKDELDKIFVDKHILCWNCDRSLGYVKKGILKLKRKCIKRKRRYFCNLICEKKYMNIIKMFNKLEDRLKRLEDDLK